MKEFDKYFRSRLQDTELPVEDGIWDNIESQIFQRKDNHRLWFFLLIPLLFTPALFIFRGESEAAQQKRSNQAAFTAESVYQQPQSAVNFNENQSNTSDLVLAGMAALDDNSSEEDLEKVIPAERVVNQQRVVSQERHSGTAPHSTEVSSYNNSIVQNATPFAHQQHRWNAVAGDAVAVGSKRGANDLLSAPAALRYPHSSAPMTTVRSDRAYTEENMPLVHFNNNTGSECPSFKVYTPGFYGYLQYTSDIPFQRLSAKNAEFVEYAESRRLTEYKDYSYSATLGVGYQFGNGIIAESGISLDRINMSFDFEDKNAGQNTTVITIDTMILNGMDTVINIDTTVVHNSGKNDVFAQNSFTQVDIPIVLGYEMPLGKKMRLSLKGGVMVNISSRSKGYMLDLNGEPMAYGGDTDTEYFKTNIGFSYTGGLNLEFDIAPSFSIYGGANFRYYPNNFSLPSNYINQSYSKLGFTTGLKFRL